MNRPQKLLVLDAAYSVSVLRERQLEGIVTSRDLGGFFEHVWTVHPVVGASPEHDESTRVGPPASTSIAPRHTMIEGRLGRFPGLERVPPLNLLLAQLELLLHLHRLIRRENVTLIEATDPYYTGLLGLALARANRLPFTLFVMGNYDASYRELGLLAYPRLFRFRRVEKRIEHWVFPQADLVTVLSRDNMGYALANGADPERVRHVRFGDLVHPAHFVEPSERSSVRDELGLGDRPFLIAVNRFAPVKHPEDALSVLAQARRTVPDLALVLVGDGAMRGELERRTRELGLEAHVVFAGTRDQGWIAEALASATVILSALTGRALVEAALSGTPIVTYEVEWQAEVISSGENGLTVPYRDTAQMADAACRLVTDPELAARLGFTARARALKLWDPDTNRLERRSEVLGLLNDLAGR